jgi:hypothetical protein
VADDAMARLVVLAPDHPHIAKGEESPALVSAREILDRRGTSPRQYRNMLLFAACDQRVLEGLEQVIAELLAWSSICERVDELNLDAHQATQARNRRSASDDAVGLRLADAYKHALVPRMDDPVGTVTFDEVTLDQQGTVAERVSRKLVAQDALRTQFPPVLLRMRLDDPDQLASRWAGGHVTVATLWDDFAKYIYLPRLRDQEVLLDTVQVGPASTAWQSEGFGVAVGYDEAAVRYLGLVGGSHPGTVSLSALVVRPAEALAQLQRDADEQAAAGIGSGGAGPGAAAGVGVGGGAPGGVGTGLVHGGPDATPAKPAAAVFRGAVTLDPHRPVKGFGDVSKELLDHLASQVGAEVEVRVEIVARKPDGFPDHTVRTVTENARALKFDEGAGFSEE